MVSMRPSGCGRRVSENRRSSASSEASRNSSRVEVVFAPCAGSPGSDRDANPLAHRSPARRDLSPEIGESGRRTRGSDRSADCRRNNSPGLRTPSEPTTFLIPTFPSESPVHFRPVAVWLQYCDRAARETRQIRRLRQSLLLAGCAADFDLDCRFLKVPVIGPLPLRINILLCREGEPKLYGQTVT